MKPPLALYPGRILVVDDNPAIHEDFRKILCPQNPQSGAALASLVEEIFGEAATQKPQRRFEMDSAFQGQEALEKVRQAHQAGRPYSVVFLDVRMPPGWDGIQTLNHLWQEHPDIQAVLCTAYADYSWEQILEQLGETDGLIILKKPFDNIEVLQLAHTLAKKWEVTRAARARIADLDETVRHRAEELLAANQQLQREMHRREQTEAQLRQSQKLEAIGGLAAGVAHDFNNLLTVIHGYASLQLARESLDTQIAHAFDQIKMASERAAALTRQLLTFSRHQLVKPQPLQLDATLKRMHGLLGRMLGETIKVECHLGADLPCVYADENNLEQVIMNLAVNARDAMPTGGILSFSTEVVTLSPEQVAGHPERRAGAFVVLAVADTGCGMDPQTLSRIFEPFFTTKPLGRGTGLGLSTVYGILKQHAGWIEVTSQPGQGTTFRAFLPVSQHAPEEPGTPPAVEAPLPPTTTRPGDVVLVVEDEPTVRQLMTSVLSAEGYEVVCASSGTEALEKWKGVGARVILLLTDLVMPDRVSGTMLSAQLRRQQPGLRVIYTSGYSPDTLTRGKDLQEGRNFLPKPFSQEQLLTAVHEVLGTTAG